MRELNVLVVDDSEVNRLANKVLVEKIATELTREDLFAGPLKCDDAGSLKSAREKATKTSFDLMLLDFDLGGGEKGEEMFEFLATIDPLKETKAILYTAKEGLDETNLYEIVSRVLRLGAFSFVHKRDPEQVRLEVKRALQAIRLENNRAMVGPFVDQGLRKILACPVKVEKLQQGFRTEKGFLFCDISGSTPFIQLLQQNLGHGDVVGPLLRDIFSWMAKIIQDRKGIVDKFIGDEVMAYFRISVEDENASAEEKRSVCDNMVEAALEIRKGFKPKLVSALDEAGIKSHPDPLPSVKMVIDYETVFWGILGSEQFMDLTILTDKVIRAARLMQHTDGCDVKLVKGGDIYVTTNVAENVTDKKFVFGKKAKKKIRDFKGSPVWVCKVLR